MAMRVKGAESADSAENDDNESQSSSELRDHPVKLIAGFKCSGIGYKKEHRLTS